jgi:[acyl-carrier-protein] S-malonyltransferase
MSMQFVLLLPGQGSQRVGMGRELFDAFPAARDAFAQVDDAVQAPVSRLAFDGPGEELTLTHNAQVALLAHSAAAWAVVSPTIAGSVVAAAGHSLGEFSAYHVAGALDLPDAARIVRRRGELMYRQGVERPGAMAAILGTLAEPIEVLCDRASAAGVVVPANFNSDEQVVVSGEQAAVDELIVLAKAAGAKRCLPLPVSGAFHSPLMAPAAVGLDEAIRAATLRAPRIPVYANVDAGAVRDAATAHARLVAQLTAPVRWLDVMRALAADFPDATFVELGSGNVLTGLARRIAPQLRTMSCGSPADVETLLALATTGHAN